MAFPIRCEDTVNVNTVKDVKERIEMELVIAFFISVLMVCLQVQGVIGYIDI